MTDTIGQDLDPPAFADGLNVWSRTDGTAGTDTYATLATAAFVPADQDFGGCLEVLKTGSVQRVRWMGRTDVAPGRFLRVTARVKAIAGSLPGVRIAATPAAGGGVVGGLPSTGPVTPLTAYGEVVEVSGVVAIGTRDGIDVGWDSRVRYAHVGLDLTGPAGGVVRIDDIRVEDVTGAFLRGIMDWVDVRDYGAVGDGQTDDSDAFDAAEAAAGTRAILVGEGTYRLTRDHSISTRIRFEGTVTMPRSRRLSLVKNFDLPTYIDAFGDEQEGFRRAIQALFDFSDHDTLDMAGRRVELTEPLDVQAAVHDRTSSANQRKIRNGQIHMVPSPAWTDTVATAACDFDPDTPDRLLNVPNVSSIPVGSLVTAGQGVGREVYVKGKNGSGTVFLSQPLWGAKARQTYTFRRFKYALDFSGFSNLQRFTLQDIEFLCADQGSGVLLPQVGLIFHVKDCYFTGPKDRGITSHADGCQGLLIDRCQFLSSEQSKDVSQRHTIGFNVNKNDAKIRNNRAVKFLHWAVMHGSGHIVTGNHFFQGDGTTVRTAGIAFTNPQAKSVFSGNYVDNCTIEWTNEHDGDPDFQSELSFGGLMIVGNIIFSSSVSRAFTPIRIKPFGAGHYVNGVTITGNTFKTIKGQALDRVDGVDTTHGTLDAGRFVDVNVWGNTFHGVRDQVQNPITAPLVENSAQTQWTLDLAKHLPFGSDARVVSAVQAEGIVRNGSNRAVWGSPYAFAGVNGGQQVRITWPEAAKGKVFVTARCDAPT
ncbi:right-handed parallel beta-helix repeat-containing protein [Jannaschia sp. Os4]|uniref:glycosyl hydrolase family 28-related protein n=1 Tax=Jannaschia sp. Os4 TaxID=2807617 RepID=UPI00193ADFDD|nr:glycosyl hydrolase family 28-related protein [Jannaschia sp. Os4]MBM2575803.1 right-handed parallel beta-helix repeat-containing protein [Jannaschia sp. Os4]